MALNFRKFLEGLRIIPKASSTVSEQGDLDVTSATGKLNYHNGTSSSPVVTEAHSATLTNKTLDSPVIIGTPSIAVPIVIDVNSASDALRITQTGSGNALLVEDSANPDSTPFVVDTNGNVGIGVTSPTRRLEVGGTASGNNNVIVVGTPTASADRSGLIFFRDDTATNRWATGILQQTAATAFSIRDIVANSSRYTIDSTGKHLFNTVSARGMGLGAVPEIIYETTSAAGGIGLVTNSNASANDGCYLVLARSRGTAIGGTTIVQSQDVVGYLLFAAAQGTNLQTQTAAIGSFIDGTPSASSMPGRLSFFTTASGATSVTERLRIDSSGRVLVGTSNTNVNVSNDAKLAIVGTGQGTSTGITITGYSGTSTTARPVVVFQKSRGTADQSLSPVISGDELGVLSFRGASDTVTISSAAAIYGEVDGAVSSGIVPGRITFRTANPSGVITERLRIDSSGRLLVGTTASRQVWLYSGSYQLENSSVATQSIVSNASNTDGAQLFLGKSRGASVGGVTAVTSGDILGRLVFAGADGTDMSAAGAAISVNVDGTVATGSVPSRISLSTTAVAGTSPTERLRIDSAGNVGVGGITLRSNVDTYTPRFQVEGTTTNTSAISVIRNSANASGSYLFLGKSRNASVGGNTAVTNNDTISRIESVGNDGTNFILASSIETDVDGTVSTGVVPGRISFSTADSAGTLLERLRIDSAGLVGINTTSPASTVGGLDISSGGLSLIFGADNGASTRTNATIKIGRIGAYHYTNASTPTAIAVASNTSTSNDVYIGGGTSSLNAATFIGFYTGANTTTTTGTIRLGIDSSGRVFVGGTSTAYTIGSVNARFQLTGNDANSGSMSVSRYSADASPPYFSFAKSRAAAVGTMTAVAINDELGRIEFAGADGTDLGQSGAFISAFVDGTVANNSIPSRIVFSTTALAGTSPTERLRIDSAGNVGIATAGAGNTTLDVNGNVSIRSSNNAQTGSAVTLTAPTTSFVRLTAGVTSVAGITAGANGQTLTLSNRSGGTVAINNEDATATAANRILTGSGASFNLVNNASIQLAYDSTTARWMVVGAASTTAVVIAVSADTVLTTLNDVVLVNASGAARTITLPAPTSGKMITIKKTDATANAVTISRSSTETIDGNSSVSLSAQYDSYTVVSDGTNWFII